VIGRVLACGMIVSIFGCGREARTTPVTYELPPGLSGWVAVELEVADAPPLPIVDGRRVVRFPASGRVATSSKQESGILDQVYVVVDADGRRTPLVDASMDRTTGPNASLTEFPAPVVCCWHSGVAQVQGQPTRKFEGFHVGRGPAGDPPPWPL
jgi:hypothetical protein